MGRKELVSLSMKGNCGCMRCHCGVAVFVRLFHTALCLAIFGSLLWKNTVLRHAVVEGLYPVYGGVFVSLLTISLVLYYTTCLTNPGYVMLAKNKKDARYVGVDVESDNGEEEHSLDTMDNIPLDKKHRYKYRYCGYCEIQSPLRSKHCEDCQLCVRKYDHHCPWLETCIGELNHKYFWLFLLTLAVLIVWTFIIVWESFITTLTWSEWFHVNIVLFIDIAVLVISGPVCIGLLVFHTYLMATGQTTWEAATRERITYLKYLDDDYNPFDEGCLTNIFNFMCVFKTKQWEKLYAKKAKFKDSGV